MSLLKRNITDGIAEDLGKKMVLVAGPRQCGKTTLAKELLKMRPGRMYNWDKAADRALLRGLRLDDTAGLWVFDELHKLRSWRNWLKGVFDAEHERHAILVTGSAKLQIYSRGGDSLQGRYFLYRLHPFTLAECLGLPPPAGTAEIPAMNRLPQAGAEEALDRLLRLGGFPEPFSEDSERFAKRWRRSYGERLIYEEVRSLEQIRDLYRMELLYERLPATVGSVLSINNLRQNLEVAFETVRKWLSALENLYACFRLAPYGAPRLKAVKKEQKLYLWDWSRVEDEAARFENLLAVHLLRFCHWCRDVDGENLELRYYRSPVGHEVDFVVLRDGKPWFAAEAKVSETAPAPGLKYFLERVKVPAAFQVSLRGGEEYRAKEVGGCRVQIMPAARFLANLP